jgi:predicted nucleotidyltransferase
MRGEWDIVIYEVKKFVSLLAKGNPNVLSLLWLPDKHIIKATDAGRLLLNSRDLFVGKHVYKSFTGYAYSQLKKMENHACMGYMGEKRKQLVQKFGYDTKNAAHLIRLLRMSIEFLVEGALEVERRDATQLLQIKNGEWTLPEVKKEAERLFALADDAYIKSTLPINPDTCMINDLLINIIEMHWRDVT